MKKSKIFLRWTNGTYAARLAQSIINSNSAGTYLDFHCCAIVIYRGWLRLPSHNVHEHT